MSFWDASALIPLIIEEPTTAAMVQAYDADPEIMVWWATEAECVSALARLEREGLLAPVRVVQSLERLRGLAGAWGEVEPVIAVRRTAIRLLRVHQLRAVDALQLGAAIVASEYQPSSLPFVTLDERLADAAAREGFTIVRE